MISSNFPPTHGSADRLLALKKKRRESGDHHHHLQPSFNKSKSFPERGGISSLRNVKFSRASAERSATASTSTSNQPFPIMHHHHHHHHAPKQCRRTSMDQLVQRSGGVVVKNLLCRIREKCEHFKSTSTSTATTKELRNGVSDPLNGSNHSTSRQVLNLQQHEAPPQEECDALSELAVDAYYQVVITKHHGIPTILQAMQAFPEYPEFLVSTCQLLCTLCKNNESSKQVMIEQGGNVIVSRLAQIHKASPSVQLATSLLLVELAGASAVAAAVVGDEPATTR